MKYDDAISNSMFELPSQIKKTTAIESVTDIELVIEQAKSPLGTLPAKQEYQARQTSVEEAQSLASPVVDDFLPSPNRLLIFGGLGLASLLGIGAFASTLITYNTTVKAEAVVEPIGDIRSVKAGMGGVVDKILVKDYDSLKPDQEIATLKNTTLLAKATRIKTQLVGIEERLAQVEGQLSSLEQRRIAESSWLKQLVPGGIGTNNNLPQFEYSKNMLLEYQKNLTSQLKQEQKELEQTQQLIDSLTIRAPQAGTVYDLDLERLGQTVASDEPIAKVISNETGLVIKALLPNNDIQNIEIGHPTKLHLPKCAAFRFGSLPGQISLIESAQTDVATDLVKSDNLSDTSHIVTVEATEQALQAVGSEACELLPGMEGELTIITGQEKLFNFFLRKLRFSSNI
ncbi:HlyD family efflux transporter periplasmic adaptor subunit [Leptothoe sp. EHU-05/26/07-4]